MSTAAETEKITLNAPPVVQTSTDPALDIIQPLEHPAQNVGEKVGHNLDVITDAPGIAPASRAEEPRDVYIACSPTYFGKKILGSFGDMFADVVSAFGAVATPNVTFHWGIIVGDYVHELNYDDQGYNRYVNRKIKTVKDLLHRDDYRLYPVGRTRLNDAAIVEEGVKAIGPSHMAPRYHALKNNCHKFVIELLDLICDPGRIRVMTSTRWSACVAIAHPPVRMVVGFPIDATDDEKARIEAEADAEYDKLMAEYNAKQEKMEELRRLAEIATKAAEAKAEQAEQAEQAKERAAMQAILDHALELMTRSETEQKMPEPTVIVADAEVEAEVEAKVEEVEAEVVPLFRIPAY